MLNAGERLWAAQKAQGTGLCIGVDMHFDRHGELNEAFYGRFAEDNLGIKIYHRLIDFLSSVSVLLPRVVIEPRAARFLAGMIRYNQRLVTAAAQEGILVFKPQSSFFERNPYVSDVMLSLICDTIYDAGGPHGDTFCIGDTKREELDTSMLPYYAKFLTGPDAEVIPGVNGAFDFDTITVTPWLGVDILTPGIPFFKTGRGAIVVTQSSNPSGTTLQDVEVGPPLAALTEAQKPHAFTADMYEDLRQAVAPLPPSARDLLLYTTTRFSRDNGLDTNGVSPIFSVMGSSVVVRPGFREIRGNGAIALVPAFGHQEGEFKKIKNLLVLEGPLAGHWGILSSSRAHNFPWMKRYGGAGNPENLESEVARAIADFKKKEKAAYHAEEVDYPY